MAGTQAALALLGLSDGDITPSAAAAAAIVADRVIELLAVHAELAAAAAAAAGNNVAAGHGVILVRIMTSTHMQSTKPGVSLQVQVLLAQYSLWQYPMLAS